ncbi:centriolin isoform X3 [Scophthalmus maximus]|uniref:centriolin isoform X3 n=1 Tax=Scophthalmus maximus TaxID=52904 RepID=UPI001FA9088C|nr:centriolin isoform X3 [Scophthalmus maximus]
MSRSQSELEGRLDDMLSRIAMETQEIQELEQQLTDGQIQVNESLQSDLRGIIYGLQKNLRRLRDEAHRAWQQVHSLQNENHSLQLHLEDTQSHCRQLEDAARTHTQDSSVLRSEALRDTEVELEADLQQLREELTRQVTLRQLECEALQAAVDKEEQTREIRESQLQSTINTLQDVGHRLQVTVDQTRTQLDQTRSQLDQTRTQLDQTRTQLHQTRTQLHQTRSQLDQTRTQLGQTRTQLDQTRTQLDQTRTQLDQTRTRTQLDQCTDALHDPQTVQSGTEDHEDMARIQTRIGRAQLQQDQDQVVHHVERDQVVHHVEQDQVVHHVEQDQDQVVHHVEQDQVVHHVEQDQDQVVHHVEQDQVVHHVEQDQDQVVHHVEQDQDQVVHHVEQDQESDLQRSRSSHRHLRDGHQRRLNRKLRQLRETMNNSVSDQLTPIIQQLRALNQRAELLHPQESLCVCECVHREAERLEQEKKKLQLETRQLQYTLRRHRSVLRVCDEVECVEKTLLKRRAELRQADRLLLEAQSCIHTTREQASSAQWEVDDWQLEATHTPRGHRRSDVLSDCQQAQRRLDSVALSRGRGWRRRERRSNDYRTQSRAETSSTGAAC